MDRLIKNLRGQLFLLKRLSSLLDELRDDLKAKNTGSGISKTVQSIETIMPELSKTDAELQTLVKSFGNNVSDSGNVDGDGSITDINDYINNQPQSVERDVATRLINQVGTLQMTVQKQLVTASTLLVNSKKFIDYNINVMSMATLSPIYGKHGTGPSARSQRSIFNANV